MNFTKLKKANNYEVQDWLKVKLNLSDYQISKMREEEIIRFYKFEFYKQAKEKPASIFWRFTLIIYVIYWIILLIGMPFTFLFTGRWGYSQKLYDKFHLPWCRKIGL